MNTPLTREELELLRAINTPTLANAMERLNIRGRLEGYTRHPVRCLFPELGAIVGYAVTASIRSAIAPAGSKLTALRAYWNHIATVPSPRVVVCQDLDQPPAGAWWGEVNANIHRALGCVGVVTDGSVRDLDEVRPLGFQFVAAQVAVSHGYAHLETFGQPVSVAGMTVKSGDLIHGDRHGALVIPAEHVRPLLAAVAAVERYERPLIQLCKSPEFSPARLEELMRNESA